MSEQIKGRVAYVRQSKSRPGKDTIIVAVKIDGKSRSTELHVPQGTHQVSQHVTLDYDPNATPPLRLVTFA